MHLEKFMSYELNIFDKRFQKEKHNEPTPKQRIKTDELLYLSDELYSFYHNCN